MWIAVVAMLTANPFLGWNAERETGMGWYILGLFHSERGDETPALTCYEQAQDLIPDYPSLLLNLGVLYGKQGDLERSTRLFERVLILDPGNRTAHDNLEINHRRMQIPPQ